MQMQACGDSLDRRTMIQSLALAMAGGLLLGGCGKRPGGAGALPVLRAAITGKGEGDTRLMLKASAIEPEGFRIDYSVFSSGQLVVEALNGGALDCGNMSEIPPVFAAWLVANFLRKWQTLPIYSCWGLAWRP
jgi:sulfonate transport system substrate-binding protein